MVAMAVDGATVDIEMAGDGPPLVLLHSVLTDRGAFDRVRPVLAGKRTLVLVNLPGFGASDPAPPGIAATADRVAGLMRQLDLGPETAVLGHGYGGAVALSLASRHGDDFAALAVVSTTPAYPESGRGVLAAMAARAEAAGMAAVADAALSRLFPEGYPAEAPAIVAERRACLLAMDPQRFAATCRVLAATDLHGALADITNPTLVMVGERDVATPPADARALAAGIPGARYVEVPGAGHAPHIEAPAHFLETIATFVDGG